jgi:hypothetical protein
MKIGALAVMTAALGGSAWGETQVTVCMQYSADIQPAIAEKTATKMFADIGVTVAWLHVRTPCPRERVIVVDLSYHSRPDDHGDAFAYALPYEGTHIVVFWDRIQKSSKMPPGRAHILLAHVLVHEITHILQGVARHSETGVMKPSWDDNDFFQMMTKPLSFTDSDVTLIRSGLDARSRASLALAK